MRTMIIVGGLLALGACTTPDLSGFDTQAEALKPPLETVGAGLEVSCADNPQTCSTGLLLQRMNETVDVAVGYSDELRSLADQGRTDNSGAESLNETLLGLKPDDLTLPAGSNVALRLITVGLDQLRINAINSALSEAVDQAQPGVDKIAAGFWAAAGFCDIALPNEIRAAAASEGALPPACDGQDAAPGSVGSVLQISRAERLDDLNQEPGAVLDEALVNQWRFNAARLAGGLSAESDSADIDYALDTIQRYLIAVEARDAYMSRAQPVLDQEKAAQEALRTLTAAVIAWAQSHRDIPEAISEARQIRLSRVRPISAYVSAGLENEDSQTEAGADAE